MTKAKDMIHPAHAEMWLKIAKDVQSALDGLNTSNKQPVLEIVDDMTKRLKSTGYDITRDYTPDRYEYFDFDIFTQDREYGIRIFLGHKWFDEIHVHKLDTMYLYAPNDVDDVIDDVTIEDIESAIIKI